MEKLKINECVDEIKESRGMSFEIMDPSVILIEPFYGGSHKQLIDLIIRDVSGCSLFTQTAKKWHWRARTSALHFSSAIPRKHQFRVLFCSSVLNLAELIALRPDLRDLLKIVYFHENQLVYPVRKQQERDFQYGYNQILTCMVADVVIFNSEFNKSSFLNSIKAFLKLMPDYRPKDIKELIAPKCRVLHFPIEFPVGVNKQVLSSSSENILNIVWPHRWEHDKNPEMFFDVLGQLHANQNKFNVYVLGQGFSETNEMFEKFKLILGSHIKHWGFLESKELYYELLCKCDIVVSTANHEFFGVAMLEAVYCGCYPLCPNRLVYPEIFDAEHLYDDDLELLKRLEEYCCHPNLVRDRKLTLNLDQYSWTNLKDSYTNLLQIGS